MFSELLWCMNQRMKIDTLEERKRLSGNHKKCVCKAKKKETTDSRMIIWINDQTRDK